MARARSSTRSASVEASRVQIAFAEPGQDARQLLCIARGFETLLVTLGDLGHADEIGFPAAHHQPVDHDLGEQLVVGARGVRLDLGERLVELTVRLGEREHPQALLRRERQILHRLVGTIGVGIVMGEHVGHVSRFLAVTFFQRLRRLLMQRRALRREQRTVQCILHQRVLESIV